MSFEAQSKCLVNFASMIIKDSQLPEYKNKPLQFQGMIDKWIGDHFSLMSQFLYRKQSVGFRMIQGALTPAHSLRATLRPPCFRPSLNYSWAEAWLVNKHRPLSTESWCLQGCWVLGRQKGPEAMLESPGMHLHRYGLGTSLHPLFAGPLGEETMPEGIRL